MISKKVLFIILAVVIVLSAVVAVIKLWPQDALSKESFEFSGIERTYLLHVPPSYNGRTSVPLVIMLHGATQTSFDAHSHSGFTSKSDKESFIVVYPEGIGQSWNGPFGVGEAYENNIDDVGFIRELINRLEQKYNIDPNRIYVAGFSNGAMMAYRLAAELSDKIAAIAPVAGSIGGKYNESTPLQIIADPMHPVAVIIFHGTSDTEVDYYGIMPSISVGNTPLSVAKSVAFWVSHDGCSANPQNETSSDGNTIKSVYTGGTNSTEVVLYTLVGGTHEWPATATEIIWDFFVNHPKQ
jgi:polyhydroxybutyrate depolymerase